MLERLATDVPDLTDQQRASLLTHFETARDALALVLLTKTDVWSRLPGARAGFPHHEEPRAKQHYKKMRKVYDKMPGFDKHHRVAVEFFTGNLREELDSWALGDKALS